MHTSLRACAVMLLLLLPPLFAPSIAFAHAQLRQADPPVGSVVHSPPAQMELTFSEAIEPRFSTVAVTDAAGLQVDKHDLHAMPGDAKRLAVGLGHFAARRLHGRVARDLGGYP